MMLKDETRSKNTTTLTLKQDRKTGKDFKFNLLSEMLSFFSLKKKKKKVKNVHVAEKNYWDLGQSSEKTEDDT